MCKSAWVAGIAVGAIAFCAALAAFAGMAGPQACDERQVWESWLQSQFSEYYAFRVMGPNKTEIEVWIDPNEGDWTMLGVAGNQLCEILFGSDWPQRRR